MESELVKSDKYQETLTRIQSNIPIFTDRIRDEVNDVLEYPRYGLYSIGQWYLIENHTTFLPQEMIQKPITKVYAGSIFRFSDTNRIKNEKLKKFIQRFYNVDFKLWYPKERNTTKTYRETRLYPFLNGILTIINTHKIAQENHLRCRFDILTIRHSDYSSNTPPFYGGFTVKKTRSQSVLGIEVDFSQSDYFMKAFQQYPLHYLEDKYKINTNTINTFVHSAIDNLFYAIYRTSLSTPQVFEYVNNNEEFHFRLVSFRDLEPEEIINEMKKHPLLSMLYTILDGTFRMDTYKSYCPDICFPLFEILTYILKDSLQKCSKKLPIFLRPYCIFDEEYTKEYPDGVIRVETRMERCKTMGTLSKTLGIIIGFKKIDYEQIIRSKTYQNWLKTHHDSIVNGYLQDLTNRVSKLEGYFDKTNESENE